VQVEHKQVPKIQSLHENYEQPALQGREEYLSGKGPTQAHTREAWESSKGRLQLAVPAVREANNEKAKR